MQSSNKLIKTVNHQKSKIQKLFPSNLLHIDVSSSIGYESLPLKYLPIRYLFVQSQQWKTKTMCKICSNLTIYRHQNDLITSAKQPCQIIFTNQVSVATINERIYYYSLQFITRYCTA